MQLTVSPLPVFEKRASAKKWLLGIKGLADHAAKFKVGKVIPLDNGATGRVDFFDVQRKDFEEFILPALRTVACVQCIGDIEAKEQQQRDKALGVDRRAQRAAVGAIEKRTVLMEKLLALQRWQSLKQEKSRTSSR